jgi:FdhD protein
MKTDSSSTSRPVIQHRDSTVTPKDDFVAIEEPLEIRISDQPVAITMRTPGDDRELAAGFCLTEGVVQNADELESIEPCAEADYGNLVRVQLTEEAMGLRCEQVERASRQLYLSSSCGLCGKQSIDRIEQKIKPIAGRFTIDATTIDQLPAKMQAAQPTFEQTGGLHAAAIFSSDGQMKVLREDIGRHNAVDKVIGHQLLLGQMPIDPAVLLISGRASFEIMQKAAMAGIAMVCAVSAASSLAVDFAATTGVTLVGFLRPGRMNVYHDPGRITS